MKSIFRSVSFSIALGLLSSACFLDHGCDNPNAPTTPTTTTTTTGPPATVSVTVTNASNGKPASGVPVTLGEFSTITDSAGLAVFTNVPQSTTAYALSVKSANRAQCLGSTNQTLMVQATQVSATLAMGPIDDVWLNDNPVSADGQGVLVSGGTVFYPTTLRISGGVCLAPTTIPLVTISFYAGSIQVGFPDNGGIHVQGSGPWERVWSVTDQPYWINGFTGIKNSVKTIDTIRVLGAGTGSGTTVAQMSITFTVNFVSK